MILPSNTECLAAIELLAELAEEELHYDPESRHMPDHSEQLIQALDVVRIFLKYADRD